MIMQLRCTYRAYDAMDEITAALSVSFNSSATKYSHLSSTLFSIFYISCFIGLILSTCICCLLDYLLDTTKY